MRIWRRKQTTEISGHKLWKKNSTLHTAKPQTFLNFTRCKILEWQVMNEKMNSNSMWNMNKNNTSVLIQGFWYSTKRNETMNDFPDFGDPCFAHRILGPLYLERLQKSLQELFSCPQPEHSVGLRFQTIPVSLQTSNFPGDCRLPDRGFAYGIHWYLLISLVRIFLNLSDFFVNKVFLEQQEKKLGKASF